MDKNDDLPPVPFKRIEVAAPRCAYSPDVQEAIARYERHLFALYAAMDAKPREAPDET